MKVYCNMDLSVWRIASISFSFAGLVLFAVFADYVIYDCDATRDKKLFRAVADNFTHGVIAGWCWINVLLGRQGNAGVSVGVAQAGMGVVMGSLIDLDHFVFAKSRDHRPYAHNTLLVIGTTIGIYLALRYIPYLRNSFTCDLHLIFFLSGMSHHLRDANRRGLWLGPVSTPPISRRTYIFVIVLLPVILLVPRVCSLFRLSLRELSFCNSSKASECVA